MEKIVKAIKSRTVQSIIVLFVINGFAGVQDIIPAEYLPIINAILSMLAVYFRVSPKQQF